MLLIIVLGTIIEFCFFLANERSISLMFVCGSIFFLLSLFVLNQRDKILLLVFLVPNQRVLTMGGTDVSLLNILIIIIFYVILASAKSMHLTYKRYILWSLPVIYAISSTVQTGSFYNVIIAIKSTILLIVLWYFIADWRMKIEFETMATLFILGCVVASLVGLFFDNIGIIQMERFEGGGENNPNIFGGVISFSLACLSVLVISGRWKPMNGMVISTILVVTGLLTQSRSFMLCMIIIIMFTSLHLLVASNNKTKLYNMIGFILLIICFISLSQISYISGIVDNALSRVMNPRNNDISGMRLLLWAKYSEYLMSNFDVMLFGGRIDSAFDYIGIKFVAHNAFLETVVCWGIFGLSIILISLLYVVRQVYFIKCSRGFHPLGLVGTLPLIVLLTTSMTGHSLLSIGFITQLFIGSLALCFLKKHIVFHQKVKAFGPNQTA